MNRIAIATPIGSSCSPGYVRSLVATMGVPGIKVARLDCIGSLIAHNRNVLCADALSLGCDVLVEADSDMVWDFEDVRALVIPIFDGRASVVGAPCSPRLIDWELVAAAAARGEKDLSRYAAHAHVDLWPADIESKKLRGFRHGEHEYVKIRKMGLGMVAVGRDTLLKLSAPAKSYPAQGRAVADIHPQGAGATRYQSEDSGFFGLLEQAEIDAFACATSDVGHESGGNVFRQAWLAERKREGFVVEFE